MSGEENFADCGLHKTMGQVHENHQSELDRLRARERELVDALEGLASRWDLERAQYPKTIEGTAANVAVSLCAKELLSILKGGE